MDEEKARQMAGHLEDKMQATLQDRAWIKKNDLLTGENPGKYTIQRYGWDLFSPSQLRHFSVSFMSLLPEGCHSGPPRYECSYHRVPPGFVHRQRLALVRRQHCIPTPLCPYPENPEQKIEILADTSLYLQTLSLWLMAEHGASKAAFATPPSETGRWSTTSCSVGWRGQWDRSVGQQHILAD